MLFATNEFQKKLACCQVLATKINIVESEMLLEKLGATRTVSIEKIIKLQLICSKKLHYRHPSSFSKNLEKMLDLIDS